MKMVSQAKWLAGLSCILWGCFFIAHIVSFLVKNYRYPNFLTASSKMAVFITLSLGIIVSLLAYYSQRRRNLLMLSLISLFALWKLHIGIIVYFMMPQFEGLSFSAAVSKSWAMNYSGVGIFWVLELAFFVASSLYWPWCLIWKKSKPLNP